MLQSMGIARKQHHVRSARAAIRAMQPAPLPVVTPSAGWADGEKFAKE
jgi:hypothetical protein